MRRILNLTIALGSMLVLSAAPTYAQRVLLHSDVAEDTVYGNFGPNRRFFNHIYLGYLPVVGASAKGSEIRYGGSGEFMLGLRNKFRLSEPISVGLDLRFLRLSYLLAQTDHKLLPTPVVHHRESLALSQWQLEGLLRLNAGARGNVVGRYLDLTGWGGWVMGTTHRVEDRPSTGPRRVQTNERGLPYLRRWPYGVGARLGSGRYAAVARYRLSDTFTPTYQSTYPELPRWTVGLEIGWL